MTFADKLKELRSSAGLTQAQLAEKSGRGLGAIRDYEQGKREPLLSTAFTLADALGVSVEIFKGCEGRDPEDGQAAVRGRPPKPSAEAAPSEAAQPKKKPSKPREDPRRPK
jgi:transcriptional regulator with XRE-family HTH domain